MEAKESKLSSKSAGVTCCPPKLLLTLVFLPKPSITLPKINPSMAPGNLKNIYPAIAAIQRIILSAN